MSKDKQTTTIELTPEDKQHIENIKLLTGIAATIGAIRYALRYTVSANAATIDLLAVRETSEGKQ